MPDIHPGKLSQKKGSTSYLQLYRVFGPPGLVHPDGNDAENDTGPYSDARPTPDKDLRPGDTDATTRTVEIRISHIEQAAGDFFVHSLPFVAEKK